LIHQKSAFILEMLQRSQTVTYYVSLFAHFARESVVAHLVATNAHHRASQVHLGVL